MRLGVFGSNSGVSHLPSATVAVAQLAEELGFDSVWAGEHVVVPNPRVAPSPMEPIDPILDPLVHLAFVAAATETILLATGIIILPQRNPLVLAKQAATLDVLSGGRLLLGIGAGYLEPEMTALGTPMARGASAPTTTSRPCEPSGTTPGRLRTTGRSSTSPASTPIPGRSPPEVRASSSAATLRPRSAGPSPTGMGGTASPSPLSRSAPASRDFGGRPTRSTARPSWADSRSASPRGDGSRPSRSRPSPPPGSTAWW